MSAFKYGEVQAEVIQEMRALAEHGAGVAELVEHLQRRLGLQAENGLFPALAYFRAAFCLSLREVLPLREWLAGQDRSEVDAILLPAMRRTQKQWQTKQLQQVGKVS